MPLSLQDIQDKQFHVRFRGFDIDEVDSFLEIIAENYSILLDDNNTMGKKIESLTRELDHVKNQESSFRNAIISAQKVADEMREKSTEEANNLLSKAHVEIEKLKENAHKEVLELESQVEQLKEMRAKFENEIRNVIETYQTKLGEIPKVSEKETLLVDELKDDATDERAGEKQELRDEKPDFSDLYEKIDLGDDLSVPRKETGEGAKGDNEDLQAAAFLASENGAKIPDLDSDVMFTLHDPLDEDEIGIDVPISRTKDEE